MVTLYVYKDCQRWMELFAVVKESEGHGRVFFFILLVGRAEQAEGAEWRRDGEERGGQKSEKAATFAFLQQSCGKKFSS